MVTLYDQGGERVSLSRVLTVSRPTVKARTRAIPMARREIERTLGCWNGRSCNAPGAMAPWSDIPPKSSIAKAYGNRPMLSSRDGRGHDSLMIERCRQDHITRRG